MFNVLTNCGELLLFIVGLFCTKVPDASGVYKITFNLKLNILFTRNVLLLMHVDIYRLS